jgi:hypothetical protein
MPADGIAAAIRPERRRRHVPSRRADFSGNYTIRRSSKRLISPQGAQAQQRPIRETPMACRRACFRRYVDNGPDVPSRDKWTVPLAGPSSFATPTSEAYVRVGSKARLSDRIFKVRCFLAGSTGRRNTGVKSLCWGFKLQGLTWPSSTRHVSMSVSCHEETHAVQQIAPLFDLLISAQ